MYEIYDTFGSDSKYPSYYATQSLYQKTSDKRKNLHFKIYDNLEQPNFNKLVNGNKSIVYDHVHLVLEEFQLSDLSDKQLLAITKITADMLKKKYNCLTYIVLDATFKEVEKYLKGEKINYGRLRKYGELDNLKFERPELYLTQRANSR